MKVKEHSEKVGLKLSIQKVKIIASVPITSLQIDGTTMEREETIQIHIVETKSTSKDNNVI